MMYDVCLFVIPFNGDPARLCEGQFRANDAGRENQERYKERQASDKS